MIDAAPQRWIRVAALAALLAPLRAQQQPTPQPPTPPQQQEPAQQQEPNPAPTPPIDPSNAAAELLRRRLGLKPGPGGPPPAGPVVKPPDNPEQPAPQEPTPAPTPSPAVQQPEGPPPAQQAPREPSDTAADALRRLLPGASKPEVAPIPNATGTPESIAKPTQPNAATDGERASATPSTAQSTLPWSTTLALRYRARHGGNGDDMDLVGRLGVDVGRSNDPVSFHLRGRGFVNLDGRPDDSFGGLDHSFRDDVHGRLYGAHFDLRAIPRLSLLRVGRQDLDETPTVLSFDGVRADTERFGGPWSWWLTGYGGVPVHYFATSRRGDSVYGVGGGFVPWRGGRVRLDWMQLRDEFLAVDSRDEVASVRWWQRVGEFALSGLHTWRDGQPRDLQLTANSALDGLAELRIAWRELLTTQRLQTTELDPFFSIGAEYRPYRQLELSLTRELLDHVTVTAGVDVRRLRDDNLEATFNREFEHYRADVTWSDVLVDGLSLSLAGNRWRSYGESFHTATGELSYRPDRKLRLALGCGYDLFRYDSLADRERVHVRTFYLRADRTVTDGVRLDGGYELLRDDLDEFHLFRLGVTWTF